MPSIYRLKIKLLTKNPRANEEGTSMEFVSIVDKTPIGGGHWGYPIPQYRTKKWQIPKYRVANRLNTDTAYFNYIYNRFRILMVASIYRV